MKSFSRNAKLIWLLVVVLSLVAVLAACAPSEPDITVSDAWGRPSPMMAATGAFYMNIKNAGATDRLVKASSDACGMVELHESFMSDNGVMSMRPVENGIEIPAGKTVELKPGGLHVMCIDTQADFAVGAELTVALEFEKAGAFIIGIEIREP